MGWLEWINKLVINFVFIIYIEEISTQYCYLNVVNMPAQKDNSVKLIVHKSLLTHGK